MLRLVTDPPTESCEFSEAMSTLASGVVVVTCTVGGRPWGTTVTAFASVSADPATVLVSLQSSGTAATAITATRRFGVSILAEEQLVVARYASEPGEPKFLESPFVAGALAHLDCEVGEALEVADHTVFFGRVVGARTAQGGPPLLYHRREYTTLPDHRSTRCLAN